VSTAKGHGTISSAVDELKMTSALVVLREDGTVLITVCAEMQLQAEGTWKASNSSLISPIAGTSATALRILFRRKIFIKV